MDKSNRSSFQGSSYFFDATSETGPAQKKEVKTSSTTKRLQIIALAQIASGSISYIYWKDIMTAVLSSRGDVQNYWATKTYFGCYAGITSFLAGIVGNMVLRKWRSHKDLQNAMALLAVIMHILAIVANATILAETGKCFGRDSCAISGYGFAGGEINFTEGDYTALFVMQMIYMPVLLFCLALVLTHFCIRRRCEDDLPADASPCDQVSVLSKLSTLAPPNYVTHASTKI